MKLRQLEKLCFEYSADTFIYIYILLYVLNSLCELVLIVKIAKMLRKYVTVKQTLKLSIVNF